MTIEEAVKSIPRERLEEMALHLNEQLQELKKALKAQGLEKSETLRQKNIALSIENDDLKNQLLSKHRARIYPIELEESYVKTLLQQIIAGAIQNTIDMHGNITAHYTMSVAKRITGTVLGALKQNKPFLDAIKNI